MKMIMSLKKKIQGRISKMPPGAYNACFPIMYMRNPEKKAMELWSGIIPEKELESCSQRFCSLSSICFFSEQTPEAEQKEQQKKQWCFLGHCMAGAGQSFPDICSGSRRRSVWISVI